MAPSEPSPKATRIGRYDLLFELATGGMGTVHLARQRGDAGFERIVAVKRVHAHLAKDPEVYGMVSDEARFASLLRHVHLVPLLDVVDAGGELVLVLEYVEGASLASLLRALGAKAAPEEAVAPPAVASRIVLDALRGLAAAHAARDVDGAPLGLVHRDVSPQNLLVGVDGTTRLIDFGIARAEGRLTLTKTGVIKGKVAYMAPERLEEAPSDHRADLFSAAAVLFELVRGQRVSGAGDEAQQMARVLLGEVDLGGLDAVAPRLVPVLRRGLARRPADRFPDAEAFAAALREAQPPAEPEAVRALVEQLVGAELTRRRERIAEALAALAEDELDAAPSGPVRAPVAQPTAQPGSARPSRRFVTVAVLALAAGALGLVGWYGASRPSSAGAVTFSPPISSAPASAAEPAEPAANSSADLPAPTAPLAAAPAPSAAPRAAPVGARPGAAGRPAPADSDLRKSPYGSP